MLPPLLRCQKATCMAQAAELLSRSLARSHRNHIDQQTNTHHGSPECISTPRLPCFSLAALLLLTSDFLRLASRTDEHVRLLAQSDVLFTLAEFIAVGPILLRVAASCVEDVPSSPWADAPSCRSLESRTTYSTSSFLPFTVDPGSSCSSSQLPARQPQPFPSQTPCSVSLPRKDKRTKDTRYPMRDAGPKKKDVKC